MPAFVRLPLTVALLIITLPQQPYPRPAIAPPAVVRASTAHTLTTAPVIADTCDEIAAQTTHLVRLDALRRSPLVQRPPATRPLWTHRSGEQRAASGHIKFRHASNAPPHSIF